MVSNAIRVISSGGLQSWPLIHVCPDGVTIVEEGNTINVFDGHSWSRMEWSALSEFRLEHGSGAITSLSGTAAIKYLHDVLLGVASLHQKHTLDPGM